MIKFVARNDSGRTLFGVGLSEENLERLTAGNLAHIDLSELVPGLDAEIMIFSGKTEAEMTQKLVDHGVITSETNFTVIPRPEGERHDPA